MDTDREFLLELKRALSIMANDPSAGETQKRGLKLAVSAIDRRVKALPSQVSRKAPKDSRVESLIAQTNA